MTQRAGIIGYPLGHTLSPALQRAAFERLGIDARYEVWETLPADLARAVGLLRERDVLGANVTVPYKGAVLPLLDRIDEGAARIGAVNTIRSQGGLLSGYNTDAMGFVRALEEDGGVTIRGLACLVLGAGGSARAVTFALAEGGAATVTIANRTAARAEELARALRASHPGVGIVPWEEDALAGATSASDLVVNCTSLGMVGGPAPQASPLPSGAALRRGALACDLVYRPALTPFLAQAQAAGARTLGGVAMLVYQGAASCELWTGRAAPVAAMRAAAGLG